MCKTGLKFGQTAQLFAAGDTVSAKAKLVLSAGKGDSDAVDVPQGFRNGVPGGTTKRGHLP
jgi:hypothetical protein